MKIKAWGIPKVDIARKLLLTKRSRYQQWLHCWYNAGKKKVGFCEWEDRFIYGGDVVQVRIPHIKGLRVADIIEFAKKHIDIMTYLPEYKTERYPSRSWIWNLGILIILKTWIVATLTGDKFKKFVEEKMQEQEAEYARDKKTKFSALPEFISLIKESKILSRKV